MPTAWYRRAQRAGALTVFNNGGSWSHEIETARTTFNSLGFPVTLNKADDADKADIAVKVSTGADTQKNAYYSVKTSSKFDPAKLHGNTVTSTELHEKPKKTAEIVFAGVFLPGNAQATSKQKEVIVVHEFIHACGLDGGLPDRSKDNDGQDHDNQGVFVPQVVVSGAGLIELLPDKGAAAMPPIRVGGQTRCKIQSIWGTEACKEN